MDNDIELRIITLKDLWDVFVRHVLIMVLAAVVVSGGLYIYEHVTYTPQYKSTATLYILREREENITNRSSDDFSLALKVVNDCEYLLKSHSVLDEVIDQLDLPFSYGSLYNCVSASNPSDTRILEVTVKADTPYQAKQIVDTICDIGTVKVEQAMGFKQLNLYEYGIINKSPCNQIDNTKYLVVAFIVALMIYAVFLVIFLLDDHIRTEEDIERYLGLSILGDIPNADDGKSKKYGYYKGYSAYIGGRE